MTSVMNVSSISQNCEGFIRPRGRSLAFLPLPPAPLLASIFFLLLSFTHTYIYKRVTHERRRNELQRYHHLTFHLPALLAPLPSQPDPLLALLLPFHRKTTIITLKLIHFKCIQLLPATWLNMLEAGWRVYLLAGKPSTHWSSLVATWPVDI